MKQSLSYSFHFKNNLIFLKLLNLLLDYLFVKTFTLSKMKKEKVQNQMKCNT